MVTNFVDDDMEDDKGSPLICKKKTDEDTPLSQLKKENSAKESTVESRKKSAALTPQQLFANIEKSRDKLFFINYAHNEGSDGSKKMKKEEHWYLVRVDLDTCDDVEESQDCENTGQYYVEFYTKALEDKSKPDSQSRWWLIWNGFKWTNDEMIIGTSREFEPNHKAAVKRRILELLKKSHHERKNVIPEFHPNLDRFTTYSDVVNLSDPSIRLVGPFDFEAVQSIDVDTDIRTDLGDISPDLVYIRDRVPISCWKELAKAIKGRNMPMPTIGDSKLKKKTRLSSVDKKTVKIKPACNLCGKVDPSKELLVFDGTSSQPSLCAHKECGLKSSSAKGRKLISTDEVSELVKKTLKNIRQSTNSHGTVFCVIDELRAQLDLHLNQAKQNAVITSATEYPVVYPLSEFDNEELMNMPDVYAYYTKADDPDGVSERNAKIAKLDHDVEKRREKKRAREYAEESTTKFPHNVTSTKSRGVPPPKNAVKSSHALPVQPPENKPTQPTNDIDDPLGLAEVNETIGVLSRIQAERIREKRRASSGATPTPPKKKLSKTSNEDISEQNSNNANLMYSTGIIDEAVEAVSKSASIAKAASKSTLKRKSGGPAIVYCGPHLNIPAEPAAPHLNIPNLPDGWITRKVPRGNTSDASNISGKSSGRSSDRYFFSPGGRRFRSRPEVKLFLECLAATQGNEEAAAILFLKEKKTSRKTLESSEISTEDSSNGKNRHAVEESDMVAIAAKPHVMEGKKTSDNDTEEMKRDEEKNLQ